MPIFEYTGTDRTGKNLRATVEADSIKTAKTKLKKNGVLLLSIAEKKEAKSKFPMLESIIGGSGVPLPVLAVTIRQFASLIKANIPLVDALSALIDQTEHPKLKTVFIDVRQQVNEGSSLKNAMVSHKNVFPPIYINMVESGEASGTLPLVLIRLAEFTEGQLRLKNKVISALTYPLLMAAVGGGLMLMIFTFVIPKIANIFLSMNKKMPWYTEFLMNLSFFIRDYWFIIFGAALIGIYFLRRYIATPKGKRWKDARMLKLPIFGEVIRMVAVSRFASTMATLMNGGVPILSALAIVKSVVDNEILASAVQEAKENIIYTKQLLYNL
jgi:general secretion pathway protein F